MTEQINLATVKALIEGAASLKHQLVVLNQQLETVSQERDALAEQMRNQAIQFTSEKSQFSSEHNAELTSLRSNMQKEIEELKTASKTELQNTVASYEDKIKALTDELTQKNTNLLNELQQIKATHQAVINRIRGLEA